MTTSLVAGAVGSGLFLVTFLLDGATRPGYHTVRQPVSALALGPRGWIQTANFVVCGLLIAASSVGLSQALDSWWLGAAVAGTGLALIASGVFPMDAMRGYPPGTPDTTPETTSRRHELHDHAGLLVFVSLPAAAVVAALAHDVTGWVVYSGATAAAFVALLFAFGAAWEADAPNAGLLQRAMLLVGLGWLGLLCWSLLR